MLASPLYPTSSFQEDRDAQYRPAKDLDAFNSLLPPPIEFVEGSSSGALALEVKYHPINGTPKASKTETYDGRRGTVSAPTKPSKGSQMQAGKPLYAGAIDTTWPANATLGCGLVNTGNTCFLNSALQCLLHTPPLLRVLQGHQHECQVKNGHFCMACSLRQLMLECYHRKNPLTPYGITTKLSAIAKHMRRGRQEDSHEFLRYAIDALQKSCLAGQPPKLDPKLAETTWVHRIFGGRLRSRVTCLSCNHNSDTFDSILDMSIDIYGVNSLRDALRKFVAVDHLKGADKYKCEKCKKHVTADKQFTVHNAPVVLTVHLKRFSPMGRKIGQLIRYDERLSLQPVMSEGQHGPTYSLYGVISHAGGGPNSGHYYAHIKAAHGQWYEMNDDSVMRQSGAPTNMKNAYILFYIRDKGQALEAAVAAPSMAAGSAKIAPAVSQKTGLVAGMKKRKVPESDTAGDDQSSQSTSTNKRFIGPRLPSPPSASTPSHDTKKQKLGPDPQAEALKKKIAAAESSHSATNALQSLTQYADSDEDIGQKVDETPDVTAQAEPAPVTDTPLRQPPPPPTQEPPSEAPRTPSSIPAVLPPIPTATFYGSNTTAKGKEQDRGVKRRSPDDDDDTDHASLRAYAKQPITPPRIGHSFGRERRYSSGQKNKISNGGGHNPYSRMKGGNNLYRRDSHGSGPPYAQRRNKRSFGV